jgi:methylglyoxal synthase
VEYSPTDQEGRLGGDPRANVDITFTSDVIRAAHDGAMPPDTSAVRTLAIIAHDGRKADLIAFATWNRDALARFHLVATATTGQSLRHKVGLVVDTVLSGPMGGDAQIAAMVAEGRVSAVLFFVDPLSAHPHDPDIRTLLRVCNVHEVPIATNVAAANLFLTSSLLNQPETVISTERVHTRVPGG